jgi:hypothetical protein
MPRALKLNLQVTTGKLRLLDVWLLQCGLIDCGGGADESKQPNQRTTNTGDSVIQRDYGFQLTLNPDCRALS